MSEEKRRGRRRQDKVTRAYTIDRALAAALDALPAGKRSQFVNDTLREKMHIQEDEIKYNYISQSSPPPEPEEPPVQPSPGLSAILKALREKHH